MRSLPHKVLIQSVAPHISGSTLVVRAEYKDECLLPDHLPARPGGRVPDNHCRPGGSGVEPRAAGRHDQGPNQRLRPRSWNGLPR